MKKRLAAFLTALCLLLGLLPVTAAAADEQVDVTFMVLNGTWADGESAIVVPFAYGHILSEEDIPKGMVPYPYFGGGKWMANPIGKEITEEICFRFNFQPLQTVTFDTCGGIFENGEIDTEIQLICGEACGTLPKAPVRDGCFFMGWYTGEDGFGSPFTGKTIVEEDMVVYAKWGEMLSVVCDGNSGFWTIQEEDENGEPVFIDLDSWEIQVPAGEAWGDYLPEEPHREGFVFDGWSLEVDGDPLEEGDVFDEASTVFARWLPLFTLDFDKNDADAENMPDPLTDTANTFTIPEVLPKRLGHDFLGWNTQSDGFGEQYAAGESITFPEGLSTVTLYALWQRQSCTIIFDGLTEISCLWGENLGELPEPEVPAGERLRFDGWFTEDEVLFEADTLVTGSQTLYPKWTELVEIVFVIENGTWKENGKHTYTITVEKDGDLAGALPTADPDPDCGNTGKWDPEPSSTADGVFCYTCDPLEQFTVEFYVDGDIYETVEVLDGSCIEALPVPEKAQHKFVGWYTDPQDGEIFENTREITKNLSLYARWHSILTLRYDGNADGEPVENLPGDQVEIVDGDYYEFTISNSDPIRMGYDFLGWADENGTMVSGTYTVTGEAVLYAQWQIKPTTFKLHYDANGGENAPKTDVQEVFGHACTFVVTEEIPERTGYLFCGWAWDPLAKEPDFHGTELCMATEEVTLYAVWKEAPRNVTVYYLVGGAEYDRVEFAFGQPLPLPQAPEQPGYVFRGWNTRWDGTGANVNEQSVISKDLVVYAQWKKIDQITVEFYNRSVHVARINLDRGAALGDRLPDEPTREKYQFAGWNTAQDGSGQVVDADTVLTENMTLYADWRKITHASVTFIDRGEEVASIRLEIGAQIGENLPDAPEWAEHEFTGWNTQQNGTGKKAQKSTTIREDTTFYAQWKDTEYAEVRFVDRGTEVSNLTLELGAEIGINLPKDPKREGFTFCGWNTKEDGTGKRGMASTKVRENVIYYALWEAVEYATVTFVDRGEEVSKFTLEPGGQIGVHLPKDPKREGFTFLEWNSKEDGTGRKAIKSSEIRESVTYYAQWEEIGIVTVRFVDRGEEVSKFTLEPGGQIGVNLPKDPKREGFTFLEWNSKEDGTGRKAIKSSEIRESVTYYAQWEEIGIVTVRFVDRGEEVSKFALEPGGQIGVNLPKDPKREGFTFLEWNTKEDGTGKKAIKSSEIRESVTYYAQWEEIGVVTVRFVDRGEEVSKFTLEPGGQIGVNLPKDPKREGFTFLEWNSKEDGTGRKAIKSSEIRESVTYYAQWEEIGIVTVRFVDRGEEVSKFTLEPGGQIGVNLPKDPKREGFTFLEWNSKEDGTGRKAIKSSEVRESVTYYAQWEEIGIVTVRFVDRDQEVSKFTLEPGGQIGVHLPKDPKREGFTFLEWNTKEDGTGKKAIKSSEIRESVTYYAQWEEIGIVTVRFVDRGEEVSKFTLEPGGQIGVHLPKDPKREGFTFLEWNSKEDGTGRKAIKSSEIRESVTYYAQWEEIGVVTVRFVDRGDEVSKFTLEPGGQIGVNLPKDPKREGFTFLEWNTKEDGTGRKAVKSSEIRESVTYYAQWEEIGIVTVRFVDRGEEVSKFTLEPGGEIGVHLPKDPKWENYTFLGWNSKEDGSGRRAIRSAEIRESVTFYAQWEKVEFASVVFLDRGEEVSNCTLEPGAEIGRNLPRDPVREGYRFLGWNSREDGTGKRAVKSMPIREDTIFYAQWEQLELVTVTFMDRGLEVSNLTLELGKKPGFGMPSNPVRSGYTFKGWNLEEDGRGKKLYKSTTVEDDVTVYAQWTQKGSNPKTGDQIGGAVTVLAVSGMALAWLAVCGKRKKTDR